jgi:hypothetical protein
MRWQVWSALWVASAVACGSNSKDASDKKTSGDSGADVDGARTVVGGVSVTVSPVSVAISPGASKTFTCTVTGSTNTACTWQVTEAAGGTITTTGTYTAPTTGGTYHIVAASAAVPAATATAIVTVVAQVIGGCSNLLAAGTWQNITPPTLNMSEWCMPYNGTCPNPGVTANGQIGTYGANAFVLDPINAGTVYLGTSSLGIWKSTDCGSTWVHINTGRNGTILDAGRNWTMVIDPTNSQVLYTVAGYGQGGLYKSTNGGVDWTQVLTQNILNVTGGSSCAATNNVQPCGGFGAFMEKITMDPTNNEHLLAGFHADCTGTPLPGATADSTGGWGCLAESTNAGQTWTVTTNATPWSGLDGPGQTMVDSKNWFYATNSPDGLWRTTTGGVSTGGAPAWTQVYNGSVNGSIYVATSGTYYSGGTNIIWSSDLGSTWAVVANSPSAGSFNGSTPMVDDGTTLYVGSGSGPYWTTPDRAPPAAFTMLAFTPPMPAASVYYDATHHLLYSSNQGGGFWRYVTQ